MSDSGAPCSLQLFSSSSKFANAVDAGLVSASDPFLQTRLCSLARNLVVKSLAEGDRTIETMQALYLLDCWRIPTMTSPTFTPVMPKYITDSAGRPHYLGHTSNWSLTIRLLHLTHQALYKCPFPNAAHHVDTMTCSLPWNGLRSAIVADIRGLPSLDHALFLINATKFPTGQMFHLFDEDRFMSQLHQF
ncbi:uncharacterized protein BDW70DRAFT_163519 [Aspergillus foveolatus]|uniref:uncharacterized protein n=1 Tax=Aspergillus foveolatus TaxID=210207 RepID=UPI003CCCAC38